MLKEATQLEMCVQNLAIADEDKEKLLSHVDTILTQAKTPEVVKPQTAKEKRQYRVHCALHVIAIVADIQFVAMTNLHLAGLIHIGPA